MKTSVAAITAGVALAVIGLVGATFVVLTTVPLFLATAHPGLILTVAAIAIASAGTGFLSLIDH